MATGTPPSIAESLRESLAAAARLADGQLTITDSEFRQLRDFIHRHTGIALSEHKRALVCSRLARRLRHHRFSRYAEYYELLTQADPRGLELMEMINAITTNKTDFFREPHHFTFLSEQLFPLYKQQKPLRVRLWSAATSTGEEAYSLAISVHEAFADTPGWDIKILATDIDTRVLAHAQEGVYPLAQVARVPAPLLKRYFYKGAGGNEGLARVKPVLKTLLRFRHLSLIDETWPMHGPFDVIFCRNVLIYFDKATQRHLLERLAAMLCHDGYLMLGHAESIHGFDHLYRPVGHSMYRVRKASSS